MIFDRVLISDFIKWNKNELKSSISQLDDCQLWEHEPLECTLQVIGISYVDLEKKLVLECTQDCGQHFINTLTRSECVHYNSIIGTDILNFSELTPSVVNISLVEEDDSYDFSEDMKEILKKVNLGTLPRYKRNFNKC